MKTNLILATDSYKSSHFLQYPEGLDGLFSYLESRGGKHDSVVFYGLQYILKEYLSTPITHQDVMEAADFFKAHGEPFPTEGWLRVVDVHKGLLPLRIKAVPEGSLIPTHNVLMTVESTDPELPWLVTWVESLLMRVWYPCTVATNSLYAKKNIFELLHHTSDDPQSEIAFKLHDFGARGVSSGESAAIGGSAHLVNFMGSDTVEGVLLANRYYGLQGGMAGFSIPAAEHSTMTTWGRDREADAYSNMLDKFAKPGSIVAVVSDSYDLWNAIEHIWGEKLRQKVIDSGATIVIRPDSGTPHEVVLKALQLLEAKFGCTLNKKGYKVLNHVRVIQGDGITPSYIRDILAHAARHDYSATNIAFGMGGGLLQQLDRDSQRFAYKCSSAHFKDRGWVDVSKDPVTDPGKKSKAGRLDLYLENGKYVTSADSSEKEGRSSGLLTTVYENGKIMNTSTFDEVRSRANEGLTRVTRFFRF